MSALTDFFGGLENENDLTGEVAVSGNVTSRAQKPRCVTVVTAAVTATGDHAGVFLTAAVIHRQCVHVGTNTDRGAFAVTVDNRNDATLNELGVDFINAPSAQMFADFADGTFRLKTQFRVLV